MRIFASLALALALLASPALAEDVKCRDPYDIVKIAKQKAPDAERSSILYDANVQNLLKNVGKVMALKLPEPASNYNEAWVIQSKERQFVMVALISKKTGPKACFAIGVPWRSKQILFYKG